MRIFLWILAGWFGLSSLLALGLIVVYQRELGDD